MEVSENSGTPKSSIKRGFSMEKKPSILGVPLFLGIPTVSTVDPVDGDPSPMHRPTMLQGDTQLGKEQVDGHQLYQRHEGTHGYPWLFPPWN